jgi:hypothetical protein
MKECLQYQPCELRWLSQLPKNWKVKKAKYFLKEINERSENGEENYYLFLNIMVLN